MTPTRNTHFTQQDLRREKLRLGVFHTTSDHSFPQHFEVFEGSTTFQEGVVAVYEKSNK